MTDFRQAYQEGNDRIQVAIKNTHAYNQRTLMSQQDSFIEIAFQVSMFCDRNFVPNLVLSEHIVSSIPLFIEKNMIINKTQLQEARKLASILIGLSENVFNMDAQVLHLFRDSKGRKC